MRLMLLSPLGLTAPAALLAAPAGLLAAPAASLATAERPAVSASAPEKVSVTVYRDPGRGEDAMRLDWLNGFALISETRTVTLPPGESTIRFDKVADSMVAVSAIVTGLPGGTIEKNRNAAILSPAALVDGTLGNRVTITRTNPATGAQESESAIVRTRADGGLVLQTGAGYEAVRCANLPERLTFDAVPEGLYPDPVYTVDTQSDVGGTYRVTLTYLAAGFDWDAHYVATFAQSGVHRERKLMLEAWLTIANSNGQSFADADLQAVAGKLEVKSDYRDLARPPEGKPLNLTCYPIGSTAWGVQPPPPAPPPPPPPPAMMEQGIVLTAARKESFEADMAMAAPVMAVEEALGDLKMYRVPMAVTVAANAQKQVAFLSLDDVRGDLIHTGSCLPFDEEREEQAQVVLRARNVEKNGLGRALPAGGMTLFEPSDWGPILVAEDNVTDYAVGQEVEFGVAATSRISVSCAPDNDADRGEVRFDDGKWHAMQANVTNASDSDADVEIVVGPANQWELRKASRKVATQNGVQVLRLRIAAGASRNVRWRVRNPAGARPE